jgi:primosomal protein N' (replication factor Y)
MRGKFEKARVVLGSATPSFESYTNARNGKYALVSLMNRYGDAALPSVEIVDMNQEHARKNWTFLSHFLRERILDTLGMGRQIILLINRRGFAVMLICPDCGFVYSCPNCSVHLIYHRETVSLKCHQCGYEEDVPERCLRCGGEQIKYKGTGIQKVEEFLRAEFPGARLLRMDQDTTRRKGMHVSILDAFANYEADILLGTQMVAKGLNFPGVKLVGVLQADIGLHIPDFRAAERTFQLLSQVAGRAGRKDNLGEVVIQTYSPAEPGIVAAQRHDFTGFYEKEIISRRNLYYPPFSRLIRIIVHGPSEAAVREAINAVAADFRSRGAAECAVLGPAPAVLSRLKNVYRYSMLIKTQYPSRVRGILEGVRKYAATMKDGIKYVIDVDPVNML